MPAVSADGERVAERFLRLLGSDRDGHDFGRRVLGVSAAAFLHAHRFFDRDFAERVDRHFEVREIDPDPSGFTRTFRL